MTPEQLNSRYAITRVVLMLATALALVVAWLADSATWGLVSAVTLLGVALLDVGHALARPVHRDTPVGVLAFQRGIRLSLLSVGGLVLLTTLADFESTPALYPGTVVAAVALAIGVAVAARFRLR